MCRPGYLLLLYHKMSFMAVLQEIPCATILHFASYYVINAKRFSTITISKQFAGGSTVAMIVYVCTHIVYILPDAKLRI